MNIPIRKEIIKHQKLQGQKIAAVLPVHCPKELLRAFNIHPIEVWGPPGIKAAANLHFQLYTCSIVQSASSFLLDKGLNDVDVVFFPHTCDSLQGMASVWKDFIRPKQKIITLYLPRGKRKSDEEFLTQEYRKIYRELVNFTGLAPTNSEILAKIQIEEKIDRAIISLCENRDSYRLSDREFYSVIRAREYLPPDVLFNLFNSLPKGENRLQPVRLLLSGIVPEPMGLLDEINKMGAQIVGDDLACCGRKIYSKATEDNPFKRMAKRLLAAPPCPTRGDSIENRYFYLKEKIQKTRAQGIIIYDPKFCEPELFEVPLIRKRFQAEKIPVLHIEIDLSGSLSQQTLNRIEAFIEMLR